MTAPIRDMAELVEALRTAKIERNISDATVEAIAGMATGSLAKYLAPNPAKNLGPLSTFEIAAALGKAIMLVDDDERIKQVSGRWRKRNKTGGASLQLQARASLLASALSIDEIRRQERREHMQKLGSKGGKMGGSKGGKRRLKTMKKRARQEAATHAARMRWSKEKRA